MEKNYYDVDLAPLRHQLGLEASDNKNMRGGRTSLIEAIEACKTPSWSSFKLLLKQIKATSLNSSLHQWGDMTLGGSLSVLDLAIDTGLPGLVKRCLVAKCQLQRRGHILAWRKANPLIIVMLEKKFGPLDRPWIDIALEYEIANTVATIQYKELEKATALATGKREGNGRL